MNSTCIRDRDQDLQGHSSVLLIGGIGKSQFCSVAIIHGNDVGELQQSIVCGISSHMWKTWEGLRSRHRVHCPWACEYIRDVLQM